MKSDNELRKQYTNWQKDYNNYAYDRINGDIDILDSKQIRHKALSARKNATSRSEKMKMTRIANKAKKNPYMYRMAPVWYKHANSRAQYKDGKTHTKYNEQEQIKLARIPKSETKFAKVWNKNYPKNKIITAKQANVGINDMTEADKWGRKRHVYTQYPKMQGDYYKEATHGDKYTPGYIKIKQVLSGLYKQDKMTLKHPEDLGEHRKNIVDRLSKEKKILQPMIKKFKQINDTKTYNIESKRMKLTRSGIKRHKQRYINRANNLKTNAKNIKSNNKKAQYLTPEYRFQAVHQYQLIKGRAKQHHRSYQNEYIHTEGMKQEYGSRYGIGNDMIDEGPQVPIVTNQEAGEQKYPRVKKFLQGMNRKAKMNYLKISQRQYGRQLRDNALSYDNVQDSWKRLQESLKQDAKLSTRTTDGTWLAKSERKINRNVKIHNDLRANLSDEGWSMPHHDNKISSVFMKEMSKQHIDVTHNPYASDLSGSNTAIINKNAAIIDGRKISNLPTAQHNKKLYNKMKKAHKHLTTHLVKGSKQLTNRFTKSHSISQLNKVMQNIRNNMTEHEDRPNYGINFTHKIQKYAKRAKQQQHIKLQHKILGEVTPHRSHKVDRHHTLNSHNKLMINAQRRTTNGRTNQRGIKRNGPTI